MTLDTERFAQLIGVIEELAAGDLTARYRVSPSHDDLDAIGYGVNCLAEELAGTIEKLRQEAADRETRESELERLRTARLASIGVLAAGIGHEINNPLTYVLGNLELLQQHLEDREPTDRPLDRSSASELVDESIHGAGRIRRIVQDLRLFARIDDDSEGPVDVRESMESCLALVGNEIRHRARLVRDYEEVPRVRASESRLVQVFVNLLVNAAHALPVGEASENTIRVVISSAAGSVTIDIVDTGYGISARDLPRVFDPFFSTKPRQEGTGLGLPICRELVTKMGGQIEVESEVSVGTRVRVTLPIDATKASRAPSPPPAPLPKTEGRARVLIVDDEPMVATTLARMLSDADVSIASGGREALEKLEGDADFDLIFCDLMMPDLSGMDVFESAVRSTPELADRFVFVTGGAFTERASRFLAEVGSRCIQKPLRPALLNQLVAERMASRQPGE